MNLYGTIRHGIKLYINFLVNIARIIYLQITSACKIRKRKLIAIMLLEHLGDIVACEPVIRYLKQKYPDSHIVWGVKRAYRELIDNHPLVDTTLILHCLSERVLLSRSGLFDEVIDLHFSDRYCSLCRKPLKKRAASMNINLTNYFDHGGLLTAMSMSAGLPPLDEAPMLSIPDETVRKVDSLALPSAFIVVNCRSNAIEKDWPQGSWNSLISRIDKIIGIRIVEIGLVPLLAPHPSVTDLCGSLSILESAEVVRRAKLFIGIDSGPAHLAYAVGTPGIILTGKYLGFDHYTPFCDPHGREAFTVLHAEGSVSSITTEHVFNEIERSMNRE